MIPRVHVYIITDLGAGLERVMMMMMNPRVIFVLLTTLQWARNLLHA